VHWLALRVGDELGDFEPGFGVFLDVADERVVVGVELEPVLSEDVALQAELCAPDCGQEVDVEHGHGLPQSKVHLDRLVYLLEMIL